MVTLINTDQLVLLHRALKSLERLVEKLVEKGPDECIDALEVIDASIRLVVSLLPDYEKELLAQCRGKPN